MAWLKAAWGRAALNSMPTVREVVAEDLGVHRAVAANDLQSSSAASAGRHGLTPYLIREHDRLLRQHLAAAASGGPSVFALLLGASTTGKTRALYEALLDQAPDHALLHPADAKELQQLLNAGTITPGTVLWLNETQRYLQGEDGPTIAKHLTRRLTEEPGIVIVGAMWRTPYFTDFTAQGRPIDPGPIRDLLHGRHTVILDVPDALSPAQCGQLRALATGMLPGQTDTRVIDALNASVKDNGRVIQHLSGGPELLAAYRNRTLFTPIEHALITAALEARRLGHHRPIPAGLLADAADGYLTPRQRPSAPDWAATTLRDLTRGYRHDDPQDRTDIRHTLTALVVHVARSGTAPSFEPADYLDEHTRNDRQDQDGAPAFWEALITHASDPADLASLALAAEDRELFKPAVRLYRKASIAGSPTAAGRLVSLLLTRALDPQGLGARWAAAHTALTEPRGVAYLLEQLREAGDKEAVRVLLARQPAAHADLTDARGVGRLLEQLRETGDEEATKALSARAAAHASLTHVDGVAHLLEQVGETGDEESLKALAARAVAHPDPTPPHIVGRLLAALSEAGAADAAHLLLARANLPKAYAIAALLDGISARRGRPEIPEGWWHAVRPLLIRAASRADFTDPSGVSWLVAALRNVGDAETVRALLGQAAAQIDLADPTRWYNLLEEIVRGPRTGAWAVAARPLLARIAAHADLTIADNAARVLHFLREADGEAARVLLARQPAAHVGLEDPDGVSWLLRQLREAEDEEAVRVLLARQPAAYVDLRDPGGVASLLHFLREEDEEAVRVLLARLSSVSVHMFAPRDVANLLRQLREAGSEEAVGVLLARQPATRADLTDASGALDLSDELRKAGDWAAAKALLARISARHGLTAPYTDVRLLRQLREIGENKTVQALLAQADLSWPFGVANLLEQLREAGDEQAVRVLLARRPAAHADLSQSYGVAYLLKQLQEAGDKDEAKALAVRLAAHAAAVPADGLPHLQEALREIGAHEAEHTLTRRVLDAGNGQSIAEAAAFPYGREADGRAASPWTWSDVDFIP
jgi:hypothetical protein